MCTATRKAILSNDMESNTAFAICLVNISTILKKKFHSATKALLQRPEERSLPSLVRDEVQALASA
eukprot:CAMPEP_0178414450 /NCGR_PEP_ID=MMETSP0689_2-20121128/23042_1 /TAXON_ID=160604 /ORGANISM="Amphidinium massartii, Strain CS-259" /LENGTH=65 /DNA_ID=CAMNT_0020035739 /DNA_START=835 /DNA_END=1032 /DNA_ORIENTATION=-